MFDNLQDKMDRVFKTLRGEGSLNEWHIDNALKELRIVANNVKIPFFEIGENRKPVEIAQRALSEAKTLMYDVVILDTAGRLHIDEELMQELDQIKDVVKPSEILFVADAMTGQDAVKSAKQFDDRLSVTGIVLTKLDGDARGGAALSIKGVVNRHIKLVGVGEKCADLDVL